MENKKQFKTIWEKLTAGGDVLIFPHTSADGDAIGSAVSLSESLIEEGYKAYIIMEEKLPSNLSFLHQDYIITASEYDVKKGDEPICVLVDCGEYARISDREELYKIGKEKLVIDHHQINQGVGDYNYIDSNAAATGEIIFDILEENQIKLNEKALNGIYVAIVSDTGYFQNSNTNQKIHEIMAKLYKEKKSFREINVRLNENTPYKAIKLKAKLIENIQLLANGKVAIVSVTQEILDSLDCNMDDAENINELLRSIEGVEVAVVIKEKKDLTKVSLRAKTYFNVAEVAAKYGGGGHIKAAGFAMDKSVEEVRFIITKELEEAF